MKMLGYYNGKVGPLEEMTVPMNDRVCWFGDGVYDAGPVRNYKIFALEEHIDRFFNSAAALEIEMPCSKTELAALLTDLVRQVDDDEQFLFYQVTRGTGVRNHVFTEGPSNLWVMAKPGKVDEGKAPMQLLSVEDTRFYHCNVKTLNLIPSVMAAEKARRAGCQEAVFYRPDNGLGKRVTECSASNCHILKDGRLVTAPADNLILPGIARAHLIAMCHRLGIPVDETPYSLDTMRGADEVLVTSSSHLCMRADRLDGETVGGKAPELFERIRGALMAEYKAETDL